MQIACYGCGRGMGKNNAEPTADVAVWYGMHDEWECGAGLLQCAWNHFSNRVQRQSALPANATRAGTCESIKARKQHGL